MAMSLLYDFQLEELAKMIIAYVDGHLRQNGRTPYQYVPNELEFLRRLENHGQIHNAREYFVMAAAGQV